VFIPVLIRDGSSGHFVLYVLDLKKQIVYYLDNKLTSYLRCLRIETWVLILILAYSQQKRRKIFRACICGSLVLSDMNKVRSEILDKVISFRDKRLSALEEIYVNRSKKEEAQKKEVEKQRKALEDLKAKEAKLLLRKEVNNKEKTGRT
ncbi:Myosin-binding protein 2, partial [Bienertia sinuspersici]